MLDTLMQVQELIQLTGCTETCRHWEFDDRLLYGLGDEKKAFNLVLWLGRRREFGELLTFLAPRHRVQFGSPDIGLGAVRLETLYSNLEAIDHNRQVLRVMGRKQFFDHFFTTVHFLTTE